MVSVDNSTALVTSTESGTGWSVDVTACNLDPDLTLKDFYVEFDSLTQDNVDFTKTSVTVITYTGVAIGSTEVVIGRATPIERIKCVTYGDRFQSAEYEAEFNRVHKALSDQALNMTVEASQVRVSNDDIASNYLDNKITVSDGIDKVVTNPGAVEALDLSLADAVIKISPTDTTRGDLESKLAAGTNISLAILNPGANEQLQISSVGGGGGGATLINIGLLSLDLPAVTSPTSGTKVWLSAIGRDSESDGGEGLFYWDEADITTTVDNGIVYAVQGGAGVGRWKRYREDKHYWDVRWYGVVGDGVTDNYTGLNAMGNTIIDFYNDVQNTIFFPGSDNSYDYSRNDWARGIIHLKILGYGAQLRNVENVSVIANDNYPLALNNWFNPWNLRGADGNNFKGTALADSVTAGSTVIRLKTPAETSFFNIGEPVLITGKQRQFGGAPPNMEYFEWHQITNIDGGTGDITIKDCLSYNYDDRWYDSVALGGTYGPVSVSPWKWNSLDDTPIETLEVYGVRFLENPNFVGSKFNATAWKWNYLKDVTFDNILYAGVGENIIVENCTINDEFEIDKVINNCVVTKCKIGSGGIEAISAATGVTRLTIDNNFVRGRIRVTPIEVAYIINNHIMKDDSNTSSPILHGGASGTSLMVVKNNIATTESATDVTIPMFAAGQSDTHTLTVTAVGTSDEIYLTDNSTNRRLVYEDLQTGTYIMKSDGTNIGEVRAVYNADVPDVPADYIVLEGDWDTPVIGEEYWWSEVQSTTVEDNFWQVSSGGTTSTIVDGIPYPFQNQGYKIFVNTSENSRFIGSTNFNIQAFIEKIEVNITEPYTGAFVGSVDVQFARFASDTSGIVPIAQRQTFDLKTTGFRAVSFNPNECLTALSAGDNIVDSEMNLWYWQLQIRHRQGAGDLVEPDDRLLAKGWYRVYIRNPRGNRSIRQFRL